MRALVPVWHENEIVERFLLSARDDAAAKSGGAMPSAAQPETRTAERLHVRPLLISIYRQQKMRKPSRPELLYYDLSYT